MEIKIKNGLLLKDYLERRDLNYYISINVIDSLTSEGYLQIIVDLSNLERYETTPCKKLLVIGKKHIENLINIAISNTTVQ